MPSLSAIPIAKLQFYPFLQDNYTKSRIVFDVFAISTRGDLVNVFISWSGPLSNEIALALKEWLPCVLQAIKPYVSSEDIYKGARWSAEVANELNSSSFGIICLCPDNLSAPWINFEAGALSKSIDRGRVSPFLFEVKNSDLQGPLSQFQTTLYGESDVRKLIDSLNSCLADPLESPRLKANFDMWWPQLQLKLEQLKSKVADPRHTTEKPHSIVENRSTEILEEILSLSREHQRLLRNPSELLPPGYIADILSASSEINHPAFDDLERGLDFLNSRLNSEDISREQLLEAIDMVRRPLGYIRHRFARKTRRPPRLARTDSVATFGILD